MDQYIEVIWTSGSLDEARRVCRYLVQEHLVACAQITPWVESIFLWNKELDVAQESRVIFKTVQKHFDQIVRVIEENTTYALPEILYRKIDGGNEAYLSWISENCSFIKR